MSEEMIRKIESRIVSLRGDIEVNEEKMNRLEKAIRDIQKEQSCAIENKHLIHKPVMTAQSWNGKHADQVTDIREQIDDVYNDLFTWQVENQIVSLEDKIRQLRNANSHLYSSISSQQQLLTFYRTQMD
ncbi:MAG: DUF5082 family protein [Bacillus sp. (in: firmicutes)]